MDVLLLDLPEEVSDERQVSMQNIYTIYKNRGSAQLVHYQRMHVVSKVSKRFPRYMWEISWTPWKLCAFSGRVQVAHSLYSCSGRCPYLRGVRREGFHCIPNGDMNSTLFNLLFLCVGSWLLTSVYLTNAAALNCMRPGVCLYSYSRLPV